MIRLLIVFIIFLSIGVIFYINKDKVVSSEIAFVDANLIELRASNSGVVYQVNAKKGDLLEKQQNVIKVKNIELETQIAKNLGLIKDYQHNLKLAEEKRRELLENNREFESVIMIENEKSKIRGQEYKVYSELIKSENISELKIKKAHYEYLSSQAVIKSLKHGKLINEHKLKSAIIEKERINQHIYSLELEREFLFKRKKELNINSPKDSIVAQIYSQPGEFVSKGDVLAVLVPNKEIYISAFFDEKHLSKLLSYPEAVCEIKSLLNKKLPCSISSVGSVGGTKASNTPLSLTSGYIVETMQRVPVELKLEPFLVDSLVLGLSVKVSIVENG